MNLNPADRVSPLWSKLRTHYHERLMQLREKNDTRLPETERAWLLGQIYEVKTLLAMDEEAPIVE